MTAAHRRYAEKFPCGSLIYDELGPAVVLSCTDGYITARRKGCMPFVLTASFVDNNSKPFCKWSTEAVAPSEPWPFPSTSKDAQP